MLHRKFKKERATAQRTQRLFRCNRVDEFLDAGKIRRVEQKRLLIHEPLFIVEKTLSELRFLFCRQILADANADGGSGL